MWVSPERAGYDWVWLRDGGNSSGDESCGLSGRDFVVVVMMMSTMMMVVTMMNVMWAMMVVVVVMVGNHGTENGTSHMVVMTMMVTSVSLDSERN
jgi:hypothetical protein